MKEFALIGLGRMGLNVASLAQEKGWKVLGVETNPSNLKQALNAKINATAELESVLQLKKPRVVITLLPPNKITQTVLRQLINILEENDVLIDAGNSHYKDSLAVAQIAQTKKVHFLDVGNNNGTEAARFGACYTVGGDPQIFAMVAPLLKDLTATNGLVYTGKVGSGHFVKAVHNAIEYGMLQAVAEGFEIVKNGPFKDVDLAKLAQAWNTSSVIRCWILELLHQGLMESPQLNNYHDDMDATGQGLWTVQSSLDQGTPAPVLTMALIMRHRSKQDQSFAGQVVNCLREKFGGHKVSKKT